MTIKKVLLMVVCVIVFLFFLDVVIIPHIRVLLDDPTMSLWTGLHGGLVLLPGILLVILVGVLFWEMRPGKRDDDG